jgi:hypothetical protein
MARGMMHEAQMRLSAVGKRKRKGTRRALTVTDMVMGRRAECQS